MTRTDLLTGEQFIPGRINQRFANARNRIKYHNIRANQLRQSTAYINRPLHINLKILIELLGQKKEATFHKQFLLGRGFSFSVHTHYEGLDSKKQFALYHFVIVPMEGDFIKILKK